MSKTLKELHKEYVEELKNLDEKIIRYRIRLNRAMTNKYKNADEIFTCRRLLMVFENEKSDLIRNIKELQKYCEEE